MAALTPTTVHQHVSKKAKTAHAGGFEGLRDPPHDVAGIANAFMTALRSQVFLMRGDRHFWDEKTKSDWATKFWPADSKLKGAPFQVYTVGATLQLLGKEYNPEDMARWILAHMLSKKWAPVCCFATAAAAHSALDKDFDISTVETESLVALHAVLLDFTARVSGQHYHELVMGAVDGGATQDMPKVVETLYKETEEEAGATEAHLRDKIQFQCWSNPFTSRRTGATTVTAIFVTDFAEKTEMEGIWAAADAVRRPDGFHGWRCPHAWYKKIPGIVEADAEREKAIQETRNGAWYSVEEALARQNFVDGKNQAVLRTILGLD